MARKNMLTVVTPRGTFTRTTARTYTHIVVTGAHSDAYAARCIGPMGPTPEAIAAWHARYSKPFGVFAWCGRRDLAEKQAAKARDIYADVEIYEVGAQP